MNTDDNKPKYATPLAWTGWNSVAMYTTLDDRIDQARRDFDRAIERILDTHGTDPRQWPDPALDEVMVCEARIKAVETLARAAIRMGRMSADRFLVLGPEERSSSSGKAA